MDRCNLAEKDLVHQVITKKKKEENIFPLTTLHKQL